MTFEQKEVDALKEYLQAEKSGALPPQLRSSDPEILQGVLDRINGQMAGAGDVGCGGRGVHLRRGRRTRCAGRRMSPVRHPHEGPCRDAAHCRHGYLSTWGGTLDAGEYWLKWSTCRVRGSLEAHHVVTPCRTST